MLPYKIRKPVYGGAKTKTKTSQSSTLSLPTLYGNDDIDDPLIYGGVLQRAILSDLSELKTRYLRDLDQSRNNNNTRNQHEPVGCTFRIFKTTFRRARFGCIHNRAVPARIDKGEFAQLVYSSCWYLLHQAVVVNTHNNSLPFDYSLDDVNKDDDNDNDGTITCNDAQQKVFGITNFLQNVTFAIFTLYTLHQTNTLPNNPHDAKVTYNHPAMMIQQTESETQRQWSYLPLGKAGVEGKLYRRHYKYPVRVDRCSYMSLMLVRDVCATIVAKANYRNNCDSSSSSFCNDSSSNYCNYNMAVDGIHVIDRMMHDDAFFTYCEYHGPVGLEGLAGNPNFYNAYYGRINDGEMNKKTTIQKSRANNTQRKRQDDVQAVSTAKQETQTASSRVLNSDELHSIRNTCAMADSLHDVSSMSSLLDRYKTNLYTIHTELCTNRRNEHNGRSKLQQNHGNNNNLKPRQRELVEKTIREIWIDGVEQSGNASKRSYLDVINKPSTSETMK
eukprot:scaffold61517_cov67-Cyclotella_meneghiniana.AAC.3